MKFLTLKGELKNEKQRFLELYNQRLEDGNTVSLKSLGKGLRPHRLRI